MQMFKRVSFYLIGLFILAIGICFSINSGLGVSPISSLPYAVYKITASNLGFCTAVIYAFYVLLQYLANRKIFRPINLLEIVFAIIFSTFLNYLSAFLSSITLPGYGGQLALMGIGMVLIAFGLFLFLSTDLVPMPMEGLIIAISKRLNKPFFIVKIIVDLISVGVGVLLCLIFAGEVYGIREGTVINALLIGRIAGWLTQWLGGPFRKFLFGKDAALHDPMNSDLQGKKKTKNTPPAGEAPPDSVDAAV